MVVDPYNEFFKTCGTLVSLHEPAKRVHDRELRAMSVFRIIDRDGEIVADADGLAGVNEIVRRCSYRVLSCRRDLRGPLPSGHTSCAGASPSAMMTVA